MEKNQSSRKTGKKTLKKKASVSKSKLEIQRVGLKMRQFKQSKKLYLVLSYVLIFFFLCLSLIKYLYTRDFSSCVIELLVLIVLAFVVSILCIFDGRRNASKTLLGKRLEKRSPKKRKRDYALEAFLVSLAITSIFFTLVATDIVYVDFYGIFPRSLVLSVLTFGLVSFGSIFLIFYLIDYAYGENKIKRGKIPLPLKETQT